MSSELDAHVAREVMGWTLLEGISTYHRSNDGQSRAYFPDDGVYISTMLQGWVLWSPSSDIAVAFEVVAEMESKGWFYCVRSFSHLPDQRHEAGFGHGPMNGPLHQPGSWIGATEATPAEAICHAALKAVRA